MLELKLIDGKKEVFLKWDGESKEKEKDVLAGVLKSFDININDLFDNKKHEDQLKEGYSTFKNDIKGLHHPKSEYEKSDYKPKEMGVRTYLGKKHYQLFYICPDCGHKGKHYISEGTPQVNCHESSCAALMNVRLATYQGLPHQDEYGNYYIAGDFKRSLKDKEEEENKKIS
jgi:hypothetical protein